MEDSQLEFNKINTPSNRVKDMFDISGKIAIITGGGGLLGEKHAEAIAEYGGIPILVDIDLVKTEMVARNISDEFLVKCIPFKCDITKKSEVENLLKIIISQYGHVDILINNAAIDPKVDNSNSKVAFSRLEYFNLDQWNKEISVGLTGAFICSQVFGFEMAKKKSGVIINISSDLGIIAPNQHLYRKEGLLEDQQPVKPVTYSVIKHGLIGLTKYIATYWAEKGVRANTLCPAGVYTNQPDEFVKNISSLIPMGRMANADEYKAAIVFLASDASSYMNGATLVIDGGRSIW